MKITSLMAALERVRHDLPPDLAGKFQIRITGDQGPHVVFVTGVTAGDMLALSDVTPAWSATTVADQVQSIIAEVYSRVWPLCHTHRTGLHCELNTPGKWMCLAIGEYHVVGDIGSLNTATRAA